MKAETFLNGLNAKTSNYDSVGGGGFDALIQGDRAAVMMAIDAPDLIWAYAFSYNNTGLSYDMYRQKGWKFKRLSRYHEEIETGLCQFKTINDYERIEVSCSLDAFANMLKPWITANYIKYTQGDMVKRISKSVTAAEEINRGLAKYLSKNPKEETRISRYFRPIPSTTFDRKYRKFAKYASRTLFSKLIELEKKIHEYTKNEQNN